MTDTLAAQARELAEASALAYRNEDTPAKDRRQGRRLIGEPENTDEKTTEVDVFATNILVTRSEDDGGNFIETAAADDCQRP